MMLSQIFGTIEEKDINDLFALESPIWESAQGQSLKELHTLFTETNSKEDIDPFLAELHEKLPHLLTTLTQNKYSKRGCILNLRAGQGGHDANDWTEILTKMYLKFLSDHGAKHTVLEYERDEVAGITNASIEIAEPYAYLIFKVEEGLHRLERKSPFNSKGKMQTSHASVKVIPLFDVQDKIPLKEEDLEIKTTRSSGPGGQNVNKTETTVVIKHIPTGIVVRNSQTRSQFQNRQYAMNIIKSELLKLEDEKNEKELRKFNAGTNDTTIRTYDFELNQVKDHRIMYKTSRLQPILNGNIDFLLWRGLISTLMVDRTKISL